MIQRCFQIVPSTNHLTMRPATSDGVEKKNGGNSLTPPIGTVVSTCQSSTARTATRSWRARSLVRDIACKSPPMSAAAGLRVALEHLGLEHRPDLAMKVVEGALDLTSAMSRGRGSRTFHSPMTRAAGPADMITTRSESAIASSRSWVTNSTALRSALHRSSSRLPMICRVCASSGPNGSSISRIFGSRISTCTSPTRFLCPPESMCG